MSEVRASFRLAACGTGIVGSFQAACDLIAHFVALTTTSPPP
jgi:hypothetical protein